LQSAAVHAANCAKTHAVARRRVLGSAPLQLMGSRPLVAFGDETYKLELQIQESGRQIVWQMSSQSPVVC
jgi:hypothetical protein